MSALFGFEVGYSPDRPIRPDAEVAYVVVQEEDSYRGFIRARLDAIYLVSVRRVNAMVTSAQLIYCEL